MSPESLPASALRTMLLPYRATAVGTEACMNDYHKTQCFVLVVLAYAEHFQQPQRHTSLSCISLEDNAVWNVVIGGFIATVATVL